METPASRFLLAVLGALCLAVTHPAIGQSGLPVATLAAKPRGVYATIDLRPAQEMVRKLSETSGGKRAAIREVLKDPSAHMPPVLYALANALSGDDPEGAIFWYHVGRLRAVYDGRRCKDATAILGVDALGRSVTALGQGLSLELRKIQFYERDRLVAIAMKAIEWDTSHPRNYDQRWIALFGKVAATSPGADPSEIQVPESDWPAMLEHVHQAHLKSVEAFVAEKPSSK